MTVMTLRVGHAAFTATRRCDATCHEAHRRRSCGCICAGRYHGAGTAAAIALAFADLERARLEPWRAAAIRAAFGLWQSEAPRHRAPAIAGQLELIAQA